MINDRSLVMRKKKEMASLSFLILVASSIASVASGASLMDDVQRTLPAYALALNAEKTLNSSACGKELAIFRDAVDIRKWWALKMLDASGQPKSGFIYGNNAWLGTRFQCSDIANKKSFPLKQEFLRNISIIRKGEDEYPPYKINYFVAYFRHNATAQYIFREPNRDLMTLGLCFPASCTIDQLGSILEIMFRERTLMFSELYNTDFRLAYVKDLQDDRAWLMEPRIIIVLLVFVITVFCMIAGTAYDLLVYQKYLRASAARDLKHNDQRNTLEDQKTNTDIPQVVVAAKMEKPKFIWLLLKCFSVHANTKYIFTTRTGPDAIGPLDGMRFFSMTWIVLTHTILFMNDYIDNPARLWRHAGELNTQIISNATYQVDSFFFISGFLMAYFSFKYYLTNNTGNKSVSYKIKIAEFFDSLWKRFLRLTPAYMMLIGLAEIIYAWNANTSIFRLSWERPHESCAKYWWRNLLYINNFYPRNEMCVSWSYYLSNDMQFFILGNFLIVLSSVYFYTAATILGIIFVTSSAITGFVAYSIRYEPTLDDQLITMHELYDPPWTRIGPYIIGIVTAYILVRLDNKLPLRRIYIAALWLLGSACALLVLFGVWNTHMSVVTSAFYAALSRAGWGAGIAWVLIACCTGNGGIVNTFLSSKVWIPLSKLSYSAYLLNPLIIGTFHLQSEISAHLEPTTNVVSFIGYLCITFAFSYVFSIMFENPYVRLVKLISNIRVKNR